MYEMVEDSSERLLLSCTDVEGLFRDASERVETQAVRLVGIGVMPPALPASFSDVGLLIRNEWGVEIGYYYVGRVAIRDGGEGDDSRRLTADLFGYFVPYSYAGSIWSLWVHSPPAIAGQWAAMPVAAHPSWLHVAQKAWLGTGHRAACELHDSYFSAQIDGTQILSPASMYCALGEVFNGPGGYFGASLGGMVDCLRNSDRVLAAHPRVEWQDFSLPEARSEQEEIRLAISELRDFGVELCLD